MDIVARESEGDNTRRVDKGGENSVSEYSESLIDEMKLRQPEELEINGVRLLTKNGIMQERDSQRWARENAERKIKRFAAIWSALNSAAIIALAIALLRK